jgi:hypothetical protein
MTKAPRTVICGDCLYEIEIPVGAKAYTALRRHVREAHY